MVKKLFLASTSTLHGSGYLEYLMPHLKHFFKGIDTLVFVPYARPGGITHKAYTTLAFNAFDKLGISIKGIHEFKNPKEALLNAKGVFVGGGNTFVLVDSLYRQGLMQVLKETIANGTPYFGISAGSNICGPTMQTTNDMPIVDPKSMQTLAAIPFDLNVHYLDADLSSTHKGESRETRIREFHKFNKLSVLGLREGSWLEVNGETILLNGPLSARLFKKNAEPLEIAPNKMISI